MAVTRTVTQLGGDIRLTDGSAPTGVLLATLTRIHGAAKALIEAHAPDAPEAVQNEAMVRLAGWMYDNDPSAATSQRDGLKASGAGALLSRWSVPRAGFIGVGQSPAGSLPSTPLDPPSGTGGPAVDQTARNLAQAAQRTADAAERTADTNAGFLSTFTSRVRAIVTSIVPSWARQPSPPSGGGGGTIEDGAVTTAKLADGSVTTPKLADDAVTGRKIAAETIAGGHLADDLLAGRHFPDNVITGRMVGADQITGAEITGDTVGETNLTPGVRTKLNQRGGSSTAGRELRIVPTGSPALTLTLPADYATYDFIFISWFEDGSGSRDFDLGISLPTALLPSGTDRSFRSGGGGRVAWDASARTLKLTGVLNASTFRSAYLFEAGVGGGGTGGDNAAAWAEEGNNDLIPVAKVPRILSVVSGSNAAAITAAVAGEKDGDLAIGYTATTVTLYRYTARTTNAWAAVMNWPRVQSGRSDSDLETFIERIVATWAIQGNADGIPGSKTFDGLFKSEQQTAIPAANVSIAFDVGTNADKNEVDETDAAGTSFNITEQQANQSGSFLRVRYNLTRSAAEGQLPRDIELILQNPSTGATITKHNLKDEGAGTAQFAFGDAGRKRWAVRCVTTGRYAGTVAITEATYHSAEPLADAPIEHVVHPIVSDEAEKRQAEDKRLTDEIARVEGIKAIVNGLPAAIATVKKSIAFRSDRPYEQTEADAFSIPSTGFVAFIVGNLGTTAIMPVAYCQFRTEIVYSNADVEVGIRFSGARKALLYARKGNALWESHTDAYSTTQGFVMLHWAPARKGADPDGFLIEELSQAEYDALVTKDANTLYLIVG